ncbi:12566_t:CDS:2, partial [Funneliformis geosporum]
MITKQKHHSVLLATGMKVKVMLKNEIYTICIIRQLHTDFKPGFNCEVDEMCE